MHNQADTRRLLEEADELIQSAEMELITHREELLSLFVCNNVRQAISNYLGAFIQSLGLQPPIVSTPANLHRMCVTIDERFESINLDPLICNCDKSDHRFCNSVGFLQDCLEVAQEVRVQVRQSLDLSD